MSLRQRLEKLEQRALVHYETLRLPDGTQIRYTGEDAFGALCALIDEEEHWLLPHLRGADTSGGLPRLIWAMEGGDGS